MNATMNLQMSPPASLEHANDSVTGTPRTLLRLEGAAVLVGAAVAYSAVSGAWTMFAALFLVPDLSMLGYLAGPRVGAACYNAAHSYLGSALLAAFGAMTGSHLALGVGCTWAAHVGFDRALGYGLKYGTSFGDTHLGHRGSKGGSR
jgi:hypothetical protein